jgi:hypothetical protein
MPRFYNTMLRRRIRRKRHRPVLGVLPHVADQHHALTPEDGVGHLDAATAPPPTEARQSLLHGGPSVL